MTALLLAFGLFGTWSFVGLAALAALGQDTTNLRITLTAPLLGTAVTLVPLFVMSNFGLSMDDVATVVLATVLAGSVATFAVRRPHLPVGVAPVAALCVVDLLLVGRPMFHLGFDWIANANDDMANYVLSATQLLRHGLVGQLDIGALAHDRGYSTVLQPLHNSGARPGADITLAATSSVTGVPPYEAFMPLILAFNLCAICGTAALAMQATRRWWAAALAAALIVASPLAAYGVLQQLLPQVWGLGLATALFAWIMRPELYGRRGPGRSELVVICLLASTLVSVYVELAATLLVPYGIYVSVLAARRQLTLRAVLTLWVTPLLCTALVLNSYLPRELGFARAQASAGVGGAANVIFPYTLVPAGLASATGFRVLGAAATPRLIITAFLLVTLYAVIALAGTWLGLAAATALLGDLLLGSFLAVGGAGFGLFKLFMYAQPFAAAATAAAAARLTRRSLLIAAAIVLVLLVRLQLHTQRVYVVRSENPIDLHDASNDALLPAFRRAIEKTPLPVVAVTEHPVLAKLEGASAGRHPVYFVSRDVFRPLIGGYSGRAQLERYDRTSGWSTERFKLSPASVSSRTITFGDNTHASKLLAANRCLLALPSGAQLPFNRRWLPEGSPDLVFARCSDVHNELIFTSSSVGSSFYGFTNRKAVSFYQLQGDHFSHGTVSGFGRYALFRIVNPSSRFRLELSVTTTPRGDGSNRLPPTLVIGSTRQPLGTFGRGSAHAFSALIAPQRIQGQSYILLDMGEPGRIVRATRSGIEGLYGRSRPLDPRYLTSYVRDVSIVTDSQYEKLTPPGEITHFPEDLLDPHLEYSGLYEDGWMGEDAFVVLRGGPASTLVVRADVPSRPGQRLELSVDGRTIYSRAVAPGQLSVRTNVPAAARRRRIEFHWAGEVEVSTADHRQAAARLEQVAIR